MRLRRMALFFQLPLNGARGEKGCMLWENAHAQAHNHARMPPLVWWAIACAGLLTGCTPKPIEGVRQFQYLGGDLRSGSIEYAQVPPAGGPHNALWQTCKVYTAPIYNEYAVHSLARGALWLSYRADMSAETLVLWRAQLEQQMQKAQWPTSRPLLLSPLPHLPAPVVLSLWNHQLALEDPQDPRLRQFLERYQDAPTPFQGASCQAGFEGIRSDF